MDRAGGAVLRLGLGTGCIATVQVQLHRARVAALLAGRPAETLATLVPLLSSICALAQGAAAAAALAAARGEARTEAVAHTVPEGIGELVLAVLEGAPAPVVAAAFRARAEPEALGGQLAALLGMPLPAWLACVRRADFTGAFAGEGLLAASGRARARLAEPARAVARLPPLDGPASLAQWPTLTPQMAAVPCFAGAPALTGVRAGASAAALADLAGAPLLARWLERLVVLAQYAEREPLGELGTCSSVCVAPGRGRALVATARGLLMHEVALRAGRVEQYVIVAPTEWNLHPEGAVCAWLVGESCADAAEAQRAGARVLAALDPCVPWRIEVSAPTSPA